MISEENATPTAVTTHFRDFRKNPSVKRSADVCGLRWALWRQISDHLTSVSGG